jgi:putative salt-induced outer membrane protein
MYILIKLPDKIIYLEKYLYLGTKMKLTSTLLLASALVTLSAHAADEEKEKSPWKTDAELGYISTTGNTETTTTAAKLDVVYEVEKWRHKLHAEAYGQEAKDDTTGQTVVAAERYEGSGKSDYKFTEHDYGFALLKLKKDRFSGFKYEHSFTLGYGRKVIKEDNMELDIEIGPGIKYYRADSAPEPEDEAMLRLSADYWWQITDNSKFTQSLSTEIGEEFTTTESVTGIKANINSTLALKFTYTIRNKSEVPPDVEKTDTETAVTLVYSY